MSKDPDPSSVGPHDPLPNTPATVRFAFPKVLRPANERVKLLLSSCAHYGKTDLPLFMAGYNELCRAELAGGKILELCCGVGDLALGLARAFPGAEVIALDRNPEGGRAVREATEREGLANARYICGDALRLAGFADASLDLVCGQATLHHLAHDVDLVRQECARVLKPGGRLVFIYEPLGHNALWAMVRAWRIARGRLWDESNVVVSQLEEIAQSFSACEVQVFNLLGYPLKLSGRLAPGFVVHFTCKLDGVLMKRWPRLAPLAANFNVVFTR